MLSDSALQIDMSVVKNLFIIFWNSWLCLLCLFLFFVLKFIAIVFFFSKGNGLKVFFVNHLWTCHGLSFSGIKKGWWQHWHIQKAERAAKLRWRRTLNLDAECHRVVVCTLNCVSPVGWLGGLLWRASVFLIHSMGMLNALFTILWTLVRDHWRCLLNFFSSRSRKGKTPFFNVWQRSHFLPVPAVKETSQLYSPCLNFLLLPCVSTSSVGKVENDRGFRMGFGI